MKFSLNWLALCLILMACSFPDAAINSLTITECAGVATTNYPIQIGRPFAQGEIANFPQVRVDGSAVTTQADVKQRWSNGSVKHAILTFLIPSLPSRGTVTITFQNQANGNNTGFLDKAGMLNAAYDFDATMELKDTTNATTRTASARTMLNDGKFTYWMKGSVSTSVIFADHSTARAYDIGFDVNRSFRPIFYATFFPGVNKVRVRYIGEVCNSIALQDMKYNISLKAGLASPAVKFTQSKVPHYMGARWTKEFWIGTAPSKITMNPNLKYLVQNRFLPNFDTTLVLQNGAEGKNEVIKDWNGGLALYGTGGLWMAYMGNVGGRRDLGPYPTWTLDWLYTGDSSLYPIVFRTAEIFAGFDHHLREGGTGRLFVKNRAHDALGRPLSVYARPSLMYSGDPDWYQSYVKDEDKLAGVGPRFLDRSDSYFYMTYESAHLPQPFVPQYPLSGDYFYLEEMEFLAARNTVAYNPEWRGAYKYTEPVAGIIDQVRGDAWQLRTRVEGAFWAPDSTPDKDFLNTLVDDAIAYWEGEKQIQGTTYATSTAYTIGNDHVGLYDRWNGKGPHPLHFWVDALETHTGSAYSGGEQASWMQNYMIYSLGFAKELGFKTDSLLKWVGINLVHQLADTSFNPWACAAYRTPSLKPDGSYFTTWREVKMAFLVFGDSATQEAAGGYRRAAHPYPTIKYWCAQDYSTYYGHSYHNIARCAASYITGFTHNGVKGTDAWKWIFARSAMDTTYGGIRTGFNLEPKWCILPRDQSFMPAAIEEGVASAAPGSPELSACPNPFNPSTVIRLTGISGVKTVSLKVYNLQGRLVQDLKPTANQLVKGVVWNAGHQPSGVYMVKAMADGRSLTEKLVLVK